MQLDYNINMAVGQAGMIADSSPRTVKTRRASLSIPFGSVLAKGSTSGDVKLPTLEADVFEGVAVLDPATEQDVNGLAQYLVKDPVAVLSKGTIWVKTEQAVTPADPVFVRFAAGSATVLGLVRKDDDGGTAAAFPGAQFGTSADANALVQLEVNLPA